MNQPKKKLSLTWWLLIGFFVLSLIGMVALVVVAQYNQPEATDPNYYENGKIDSVRIHAAQNRDSHWHPSLRVAQKSDKSVIIITVASDSGKPISNLKVSVGLQRLSSASLDVPVSTAVWNDSLKSYDLVVKPLLQKGMWHALLTIDSVGVKSYHVRSPFKILLNKPQLKSRGLPK